MVLRSGLNIKDKSTSTSTYSLLADSQEDLGLRLPVADLDKKVAAKTKKVSSFCLFKNINSSKLGRFFFSSSSVWKN